MADEPRENPPAIPPPNALPAQLRAGLESALGHDLSSVEVDTNSARPASVGELAYTQGQEIHLAPGQDHHRPHESWHVVQQSAGRVQPTTAVNGEPLNDHASLEREADLMGSKVHDANARAVQRPTESKEEDNLKKT